MAGHPERHSSVSHGHFKFQPSVLTPETSIWVGTHEHTDMLAHGIANPYDISQIKLTLCIIRRNLLQRCAKKGF